MHDGSASLQKTMTKQEHTLDAPLSAPPSAGQRRITGDHLILWAAALSFLVSTSIAAVISYKHAFRIALRYGEAGIDAQTLPLTVDGLVATCSLVILYRIRKGRRPPWHAWALLIVAVIATVCANIANGLAHGPVGAIVAGWPALVAVGCFELLMRLLHDSRDDQTTSGTPQPITPQKPSPTRANEQPEDDSKGLDPDVAPPGTLPDLVPEIVAAALRYSQDLAEGFVPSIRQLKRELHIGHTKAARIHHALASSPKPPETRRGPASPT